MARAVRCDSPSAGAGVLTLAGSSAYSGGSTLNLGTLVVANGGNGSALGSGTLTLNGGTLAAGAAGGTVNGLVQAGQRRAIPSPRGPACPPGIRHLEPQRRADHQRLNTTLTFNLSAPVIQLAASMAAT